MDTSRNELANKLPLTAMVVEDEPLARQGLLLKLQDVPCIKVISACASAIDAQLIIKQHVPNVIFLDIEMPGMSGVQFLKWLKNEMEQMPTIVFVTAFKEFALDAYEYEALDYLLKPFADDRFDMCIKKIKAEFDRNKKVDEYGHIEQLLKTKTGNNIEGFVSRLESSDSNSLNQLDKTISLKSGTQWIRISLSSINWIEAAGDYMCVHTHEGTQIIRKTLKQFESELSPKYFARVNRSAIISLNKLSTLTPNSNGEYVALLTSGDKVKVTRKYKCKLDELAKV